VIAGQRNHTLLQLRMRGQGGEDLRPFARPSGVGQVAGDQDRIQRPGRMDGIKPRQRLPQARVAARAGASAFDDADHRAHGAITDATRPRVEIARHTVITAWDQRCICII
jgi:hypothetical protein